MRQLQPPPSVIQLSMKNRTEMSGARMAGENTMSFIKCWNPPAPVTCHTAPANLRTAHIPAPWKWCCWRPEQQTKLSCKLLVTQLIANASTQISAISVMVNSAFTSFCTQPKLVAFMCGLIHSHTSASTEGAVVLSLPFPVCSLTAWSAPAPAAAPVPPLQTAASPLPEPGSGVPVPRPKEETGGYSASTFKSQELVPC